MGLWKELEFYECKRNVLAVLYSAIIELMECKVLFVDPFLPERECVCVIPTMKMLARTHHLFASRDASEKRERVSKKNACACVLRTHGL